MQGHLPLDQVALSPIQPDTDYLCAIKQLTLKHHESKFTFFFFPPSANSSKTYSAFEMHICIYMYVYIHIYIYQHLMGQVCCGYLSTYRCKILTLGIEILLSMVIES